MSDWQPIETAPGRGKNKPMPPKEGPLWRAFLEWFSTADLGRAMRRADVWRAFSAGYQKGKNIPSLDQTLEPLCKCSSTPRMTRLNGRQGPTKHLL